MDRHTPSTSCSRMEHGSPQGKASGRGNLKGMLPLAAKPPRSQFCAVRISTPHLGVQGITESLLGLLPALLLA